MDESLDSSLLKTSDDVLEELCTAANNDTNDMASSVAPSSAMATPTPDLSETAEGGWACQEAQLRTLTPLWETVPFGSPNPLQVQSLVSRSDTEASDLNEAGGCATLTRHNVNDHLGVVNPLSPLPPRSPVAPARKVRQSPISPAHTKLDDLNEMVDAGPASASTAASGGSSIEIRNLLSEVDERIKISLDIEPEKDMRNSLSQVRRDVTDLRTNISEAKHEFKQSKSSMMDMVDRLEPRFPKANTCFPPPSRPQPFRPTNRDLAAETEVTLASLRRDLNRPVFQRPLSRPWEKEKGSDTTRQFR